MSLQLCTMLWMFSCCAGIAHCSYHAIAWQGLWVIQMPPAVWLAAQFALRPSDPKVNNDAWAKWTQQLVTAKTRDGAKLPHVLENEVSKYLLTDDFHMWILLRA